MDLESRFPLLGEPLALDLVNTRVRRNGFDVDLLDRCAALTAWLHAERGRVPWRGAATAADLVAVRHLRVAIDTLLRTRRAGTQPPAAALARLNRALATGGRAALHVTWGAAGPQATPLPAGSRRDALLHALASDAADLLLGVHAGQVRECAHPACRLQFLAVNPRRRWCSGAACGNRARVAQHYQRQHRSA